MRIYTRTGDDGQTGLFGGGRVSKSDVRVEAYGAVDELNSVIGWVISLKPGSSVEDELVRIQSDLFTIGAQLATPREPGRGKKPTIPELNAERITVLERWMDRMEEALPELRSFILPGGTPVAAALHVARTVCRRAERRVVTLAESNQIDPNLTVYLNRLSDSLFVAARYVNQTGGRSDQLWDPPR
jgi:cob(I)alamin adenosyltransferase